MSPTWQLQVTHLGSKAYPSPPSVNDIIYFLILSLSLLLHLSPLASGGVGHGEGLDSFHSSGAVLPELSSHCAVMSQGLAAAPAIGTMGGYVGRYNLRELSWLEKGFLKRLFILSVVCNS